MKAGGMATVSIAMPTQLVDTGEDIWKERFPDVPAESLMGYVVAAWGFTRTANTVRSQKLRGGFTFSLFSFDSECYS